MDLYTLGFQICQIYAIVHEILGFLLLHGQIVRYVMIKIVQQSLAPIVSNTKCPLRVIEYNQPTNSAKWMSSLLFEKQKISTLVSVIGFWYVTVYAQIDNPNVE